VKLRGDCVIHTLSGNQFVSDLHAQGISDFGFTWDGECVTVARFSIQGSYVAVPNLIELDDGSIIRCGRVDKVCLLEGNWVDPLSLKPGSSLLPLYMKKTSGYPTYRDPGNWFKGANSRTDKRRWRRIARMVAEWKLERRLRPDESVRCADGNPCNCSPDNIVIDYKKTKGKKGKATWAQPIFDAHKIYREMRNHELVSATTDVSRELFSINVMDSGNLAVSGIFVGTE
jgi:hypothetical protein